MSREFELNTSKKLRREFKYKKRQNMLVRSYYFKSLRP